MAVVSQYLLRAIAFTMPFTYACPVLSKPGGCSLYRLDGVSHTTDGSVPFATSLKKKEVSLTLPSSPSVVTSVKYGNGFQMLGVRAVCGLSRQLCWSPSQSGSNPSIT